MKAFGLKKRELARGYNVHGFHIGSSQWSKKVNGKGERNISALGLCRSKPEHLIQTKNYNSSEKIIFSPHSQNTPDRVTPFTAKHTMDLCHKDPCQPKKLG